MPKEAIFLLYISCIFLARPGDISGNFFLVSGICGGVGLGGGKSIQCNAEVDGGTVMYLNQGFGP